MPDEPIVALVERAQSGDLAALEDLVRATQDRIYQLALRMVGDPEDTRDATQEILVKLMTRLGSFRGESAFATGELAGTLAAKVIQLGIEYDPYPPFRSGSPRRAGWLTRIIARFAMRRYDTARE